MTSNSRLTCSCSVSLEKRVFKTPFSYKPWISKRIVCSTLKLKQFLRKQNVLFGTSAHPAVRQRADRFFFHHKKNFIPKKQQSPMVLICINKCKSRFHFSRISFEKRIIFNLKRWKECILHVFKICGIRWVN